MQSKIRERVLLDDTLAQRVSESAYVDLAAALNAPTEIQIGGVPMSGVLLVVTKFGLKPRLRAAMAQTDSPELAVLAEGVLDLIATPHVESLDMSDEDIQKMLGALINAGVVPSEASEALMATASVPISWARMNCGRDVTADDVRMALRDDQRAIGLRNARRLELVTELEDRLAQLPAEMNNEELLTWARANEYLTPLYSQRAAIQTGIREIRGQME